MEKNTNQTLISLLNLKLSDIDDIYSSRDSDGKLHISVKLAHLKKCCPVCGSFHTISNGFYKKNVIVSQELFQETDVTVIVPRYTLYNA